MQNHNLSDSPGGSLPGSGPETIMNNESGTIQIVALYAFLINLGLAAVKVVLAYLTDSLAITAGAIDSGTDSIASLAVFGGVILSTRKTKTFPLGLYKIENLISVVIAISIFFAGYEIIRQTLKPASKIPEVSLSVLLLLVGTTAVTFFFGQYALRLGKRTESPTLIAEGRHRQVDVVSSLVVLASVSLNYLKIQFSFLGISIDQIAAALVVIFILYAGWELLSEGMRVLLDASVDHQTLDRAREIIMQEPLVAEINSLVGRNAGRFRFLQTNVTMRTDKLSKAHQASENIEKRIRGELCHVERVMVHIEPQPMKKVRLALPLDDMHGSISDHFGDASYFALIDIWLSQKSLEQQTLLHNPFKGMPKGKGLRVAEWLVEHKVDRVVAKEDLKHKGPGYVFANAGISVYTVNKDTLADALEEYLGGKLHQAASEEKPA